MVTIVDEPLHKNFLWISQKFGIHLKGALHVGAHIGQEAPVYQSLGVTKVIWFEANPKIYQRLIQTLEGYPDQIAYCCLVSDKDHEMLELGVTNNDAQSSSVLEFDQVKMRKEYSGLEVIEIYSSEATRLDSFLRRNQIDIGDFNILNLDLQGYELSALRGLGGLLSHFEIICSEVNISRIYQGGALLHQLDSYLGNHGFNRVWLSVGGSQGEGWYVRLHPNVLQRLAMVGSALLLELTYRIGLLTLLKSEKHAFGSARYLYYKWKGRRG